MLREQIQKDVKEALKSGDVTTRDTLRMLLSSVQKHALDTRVEVSEVSDEEVLKIISRNVKQRKDSISQFESAGRPELAESEKKEIEILEKYLPEQMSDEAIAKIVTEVIAETGATNMADMGKVMGAAMQKTQGKADGTRVKAQVESALKTL